MSVEEARRHKLKADLVRECINQMPQEAEKLLEAWDNGDPARVKSIVKTFETHIVLIEDTLKDQWYHSLE